MSTLTQEQFMAMMDMQSEFNNSVKSDWLFNPPNYALAAVMELVEGLDHTPWKWWKHDELSIDRFFMEVVDAIQFVLSDCIIQAMMSDLEPVVYTSRNFRLLKLNKCNANEIYNQSAIEYSVLDLINDLSTSKRFLNVNFFICFTDLLDIANALGYTHQQVFTTYIGKNLLNHFRQENGYKKGTYIKMWDTDKEDNDFLQDFLNLNGHFEPNELIAGAKEYLAKTYETVKGSK